MNSSEQMKTRTAFVGFLFCFVVLFKTNKG